MGEYRQKLMEDLVAVEMLDEPEGRVRLPDWQRTLRGRVVAVGPGRTLAQGASAPMACHVGELVSFGAAVGMESVYDGMKLRLMHDSDIDAVWDAP